MSILRLILLPLCLAVTGCSLFFSNPEITVKDVNLIALDGGGVTVEFLLTVRNPNSFDLKLHGYSYNLNVYDLPLAKDGGRETITFTGNAVTEVRLPVRVDYRALGELLKRRPDPDSVPYQLSAEFEVETPFGTATLPVERSGTFVIPKRYRPDYYLQKLNDVINGLH